jgi:hypothetical protein
MKISVSDSLAYTGVQVMRRNHTYDVSVVYQGDWEPWMDHSARSLRPHIVRSLEQGEAVLKLYKEFKSD